LYLSFLIVTLTVKVTLRYAHLSSDHRKLALDILCKIVTKGKIKKFTEGVDLEMLSSKEIAGAPDGTLLELFPKKI